MNWPDIVNACFEAGAALAIVLSILRLRREKMVMGYDPITVAFFTVWGGWNIYFYGPALGQWFSLGAGIVVFVTNFVCVSHMYWYIRWPGGREEYMRRTEELLS
jgi:hypothetical protein